MATPLLKNYGFQSTSEDEFDFDFEIPNNCNYTAQYDSIKKVNIISIQLNSGQSQPSTTYAKQYSTFSSDNGILNLQFQEIFNGVTSIKPKITVTSI
ncbi:hypothetical protein FEDK69T_27760 [Flavobacterium enshiense DK69]|uniref:Uncharacterized protein n=1 Tax=Flavobacterium enshiense DK69 TaxID=1107311 RepID=V6S1K0_9FLAO|nr:hypothetical protein [Flavobacterium enshiense]ESU20264.1 hypothetical protein FEDK69T_27760 [Flavobacterium enshiense DK69]KGO95922.1 hypothetical protein Q767_09595 [Flavobacterium enshiense DK69]